MGQFLGIGAGAGFVSALLFAVVTTGNPLAIILYFVAPLPILLAALGWNHRAGLAAAVAGGAIIAIAFAPLAGLVFAVSVALPAWWSAYLVLLSRANPDGTAEWYPLGRLLLWIAGIAAGLTLIGALLLGADYDRFVRTFERAVRLIEEINPNAFSGVTADAKAQSMADLAQLLALAAPPISAAVSVGSGVLLLWIAAKIVSASGRLPRPWPSLPDTVVPRIGLTMLVITLAASVILPSFGGLIARSAAAALLMVYCLQGLAVLHVLTRGVAGRGGILTGVYLVFFVLPGWPALLAAVVGLADAVIGIRARRAPRAPFPPST